MNYYASQILHAVVDGEDLTQKVLDFAYNAIIEEDKSFSIITPEKFEDETSALNLELFLLAWFRHFKKIEKSIIQSIFTYNYFSEMGRLDIWENMREYNSIVAKMATMKADGHQMSGEKAIERAIITGINQKRWSLAENWCKVNNIDVENPTKEQSVQLKCVGQCLNRIDADIMKNNEIGNRILTAFFLYRIGWSEDDELNTGAMSKLAAHTLSMYESAEYMIKNTKLDV
jgi:hypothetical protein